MKGPIALVAWLAAVPASGQEVWKWQASARAEASGTRSVTESGHDLGGLAVSARL